MYRWAEVTSSSQLLIGNTNSYTSLNSLLGRQSQSLLYALVGMTRTYECSIDLYAREHTALERSPLQYMLSIFTTWIPRAVQGSRCSNDSYIIIICA